MILPRKRESMQSWVKKGKNYLLSIPTFLCVLRPKITWCHSWKVGIRAYIHEMNTYFKFIGKKKDIFSIYHLDLDDINVVICD